MTLQGTIRDGIVVLEGIANLPNGTPVTVVIEWQEPPADGPNKASDGEHRRRLEIMDRIAALPIEGTGEPFSGRDHDQALYGQR